MMSVNLLLVLCLLMLTAGCAGPSVSGAGGMEEKMFVYEGVRIVYVDEGEGDAVYLAHGASCDYLDWREQIGPLSRKFRVIAADEPFLGKSDPGVLPRDHRRVAPAIWALLDHVGVGKAALVGHSGGASLCREMYLADPGRVRAFISVDSGTGGKLFPSDRLGHPRVMPPEMQAGVQMNRAALAEMGRETDYPSDLNVAILRAFMAKRERLAKLTKGQKAPLITEEREKKWCKAPLLLFTSGRGLVGQDDLPADFIKMRAAGDDARVVVVRDSGHWIMIEQPEIFNRETIAFLEALQD